MEKQETIQRIKEMRQRNGMSQEQLAQLTGVSRIYINMMENGKKEISERLKGTLEDVLLRFDPQYKPEILFDYCRIRFPTLDIRHVLGDVLRIRIDHMHHEDYGFYGYAEQYVLGDVAVMTSPDEKKGILLELKGKGCRQFERYLAAQGRDWFQFLRLAISEGCIFKRIDLAINDKAGILDIPYLIEKWKHGEYESIFQKFERYESGNNIKERKEDKENMGSTLYAGSASSEVRFCIYEKDYEQYVKRGIAVEDAQIKNRFEIRLKNDRAKHAIDDLLDYENPGRTAFGIINRYLRFVECREEKKKPCDWKTDEKWRRFLGTNEQELRLTTKPEPYTFEKTVRWFGKQVAPMWKTVMEIDAINGTDTIGYILENTKLQERHKKLIAQQTLPVEELIV